MTTWFFWHSLGSIHKFIIELHALQYLFVRRSKKQQRRGGIISNFTKGETFFISYNNQVLLEVISRFSHLLGPSIKRSSSPLHSLAKKGIYLDTTLKEERTYLFESCQGVPYFHKLSRKRMMNTSIMVKLPSYARDSLEDKSMLAPSKKGLPSPFSLARKRIYLAPIWKKSLLICLESYHGIPFSYRQSRKSMVNTLLMVNTTPICKR